MKALEIKAVIDENGKIQLEQPLEWRNTSVKVIILIAEEEFSEDREWLAAASKNETFDFLRGEEEDIYEGSDGVPFSDEAPTSRAQV